jgi:nucleoside-diphosphate-sugar epimerase
VDTNGFEGAVAIVGGSGLIGRALFARLDDAGASPRVLDRAPPPAWARTHWIQCELGDVAGLTRALAGVDLVYHLAAARSVHGHAAETYHEVNVEGTRSLCAAASAADVGAIVFASSATVYGRGGGPREGTTCRPRDAYATSKLAAERVLAEWREGGRGRRLTIVRPAVVFGPGAEGPVNRILRGALEAGYALPPGSRSRKSVAYVENLAAFLAFVRDDVDAFGIFNYADEPDLSLEEIVAVVRDRLGLGPAARRRPLEAYWSAVRGSVARRLGHRFGHGGGVRALFAGGADRRLDASRARRSGFVQPVDVHMALEKTARAELSDLVLTPSA